MKPLPTIMIPIFPLFVSPNRYRVGDSRFFSGIDKKFLMYKMRAKLKKHMLNKH